MTFDAALHHVTSGRPEREALSYLISARGDDAARLRRAACEVRERAVGPFVHLRGLIEFSNICERDCLYCGIRRDREVGRFSLADDVVVSLAREALARRYGAVVLQSGELRGGTFAGRVEKLTRMVKSLDPAPGITLSCGEQSPETFRRWREAGADRYLLRIETTNPELFRRIHCPKSIFEKRLQSLRDLRDAGYQVGTGVMIGLPGQTCDDLANDVLFFLENDVDMIGMGPFVPCSGTPMDSWDGVPDAAARLDFALNMISVTRLVMPDLNIAAATALDAISPDGRMQGIMAGANVLMPNLGPDGERRKYLLYDNKPVVRQDDDLMVSELNHMGLSPEWDSPGTPLHYLKRTSR
ncbi:MAG: [FeFe] hydrogenase H-cluster radical SAM maturase HydE [Victivallaceae bacterium]|nr:[FeFe] hydrogenase H-cluster radical SAM maturase HydE [Victivallaceae bacterium]